MKLISVLQFSAYLTYGAVISPLLAISPQNAKSEATAPSDVNAAGPSTRNKPSAAPPKLPIRQKGGVLLASSGSSLTMIGKSSTRARVARARAAHQQAEAAAAARQHTNQTQNSQVVTNNTSAANQPANSIVRPNNSVANSFVPPANSVAIPVRPVSPSTNAVTKVEKAPDEGPKVSPVYEANGPLYDDKDPLLGYQREQAARGNPESEYAMGMRYLAGTGVEQDDKMGREWLEKASAHGNLRARAKLRELDHHHEAF